MKQQLILEPSDQFGGYYYLKYLFEKDATNYLENFDLLIDYLISTYNRKDINKKGKTLAVCISSYKSATLFVDDNSISEYYLFPVKRTEAIKRLNELSEYIDKIKADLELSMHIEINTLLDCKNEIDDAITITLKDAPIARYKKMLRFITILFPGIIIKCVPRHTIFMDDARHLSGETRQPWTG